jgi:hypothetical protein
MVFIDHCGSSDSHDKLKIYHLYYLRTRFVCAFRNNLWSVGQSCQDQSPSVVYCTCQICMLWLEGGVGWRDRYYTDKIHHF